MILDFTRKHMRKYGSHFINELRPNLIQKCYVKYLPSVPTFSLISIDTPQWFRTLDVYVLKRHLRLRNRLLDQGYKKIRLIRSLKKFIFRYQDLVEIYSVSAEKIINDGFSYSENV